LKYCKKCILPNTRPNLLLNEEGVCNACIEYNSKPSINWVSRLKELERLVKSVKDLERDYDCLIPVSGGKDSTWQTVKCLELGLKPLAVTWKTPGRTTLGQQNLDNLISLGVDHIDFTINPKVEKYLTLRAFNEFGASAIPMHLAIFSIPMKIALNFSIPLIIYGENSAIEYGGNEIGIDTSKLDERWKELYGVTHGTTAQDWQDQLLKKKDLTAYESPSSENLNAKGIKAIFLGHYLPWDPRMTRDTAIKNGFKVNSDGPLTGVYEFADIDDYFISIHHWLKWYKFGFTRAFDNLSLDIRKGLISREEALNTISKLGDQTPHGNIEQFCKYVGITISEAFEIAEKFRNHDIWKKSSSGIWEIPDFIISDWRWS
jgi:N-acetyl sugar amidotransferase